MQCGRVVHDLKVDVAAQRNAPLNGPQPKSISFDQIGVHSPESTWASKPKMLSIAVPAIASGNPAGQFGFAQPPRSFRQALNQTQLPLDSIVGGTITKGREPPCSNPASNRRPRSGSQYGIWVSM